MFNSVFTKTIWERRKSIALWSIGVFLYALMIGLLYPSFKNIEGLEAISESVPEAFQALVGEMEDITSPTGFLGAEFYNLTLPLLMSILAIGFGASTLSKEEESGTIELLLASPINRSIILLQKALVLVVNLFIVGFFGWLAIAISTVAVDFDIDLVNAGWATIAAIALSLCFGILALTITAVGAKRGVSIGIATVLFATSYFLNTMAILITEIEPLQKLSLMYYYDGQNILKEGLELQNIAVLIVFVVISYIIGNFKFEHRDIGA